MKQKNLLRKIIIVLFLMIVSVGMMAGSTMALIPLLIVFLFAQEYFIEGISLSGIKA